MMVELVRMGNMEDLGELVKVGKEIELKKPNSAVACQVGLAVAQVAMTRGERELASWVQKTRRQVLSLSRMIRELDGRDWK